jgi:hypothetical protein
MTKNNLHNPHDALLRRQLQNIEVARAMLRRAVPECVRSDIQWDTLTIENSSFVSPALQAKESDLVFSAKLGDEVLDFDKVSILIALPVMARTKQFLAWFQEQLEQDRLQSYLETYGKDEAESIILYIINFMPPKEREKVFDMLQRKIPHYTEEVRSIADVIRLEGY